MQGKQKVNWELVIIIVFAVVMIGGCLLLSGIACDGNGIMTCIG